MSPRVYDVIVTGAGPAGLCTAIGLRRHGYSVALVERRVFPRPHIGEAITPGVRDLLRFLDIVDVLDKIPRLEPLLTLRRWERESTVDQLPANGSFVVDRGLFDQSLMLAARERGVDCFHAPIDAPARFRVDARGRQPAVPGRYFQITPAAVAIWEELKADPRLWEGRITRIEALPNAWLWGAPTTAGGYRVLAITDPRTLRGGTTGSSLRWLRSTLARSALLHEFAEWPAGGTRGQCAAGAYVHRTPWGADFAKVGDAAFALDPLASGGVEKAIRHALQCVVAIHTLLDGDTPAAVLARRYYLSRLAESVASHARWTAQCYRRTFASDQPFWKDRREVVAMGQDSCHAILDGYLANELASVPHDQSDTDDATGQILSDESINRVILGGRYRVSVAPDVRVVQSLCVVDHKVTVGEALWVPSSPRPTAYLNGIALAPLLAALRQPVNVNSLVLQWASRLPLRQAMETMHWLLRHGYLEASEDAAAGRGAIGAKS